MKKLILAGLVAGSMSLMAGAPASYAACKACHGEKGEKAFAATPTKIPANLTKAQVLQSLKDYKAGKGGPMKAMMAGQVAGLDEAKMQELANYIGK
jgi:cytochrome c